MKQIKKTVKSDYINPIDEEIGNYKEFVNIDTAAEYLNHKFPHQSKEELKELICDENNTEAIVMNEGKVILLT